MLTLLFGALAMPATSWAAHGHGHRLPPGNSGASQYSEDVPAPGGNHSSNDVGGGGGGGDSSNLPPGVVSALQAQGAAGAGAARFAQATGPGQAGKGGNGAGGGENSGQSAVGGNGGGLGDILDQVAGGGGSDSGGMGILLPIILGASLLAAIAVLATRWARRGPAGGT
jgi:hypothetical protein